jgi:hypothetical protein
MGCGVPLRGTVKRSGVVVVVVVFLRRSQIPGQVDTWEGENIFTHTLLGARFESNLRWPKKVCIFLLATFRPRIRMQHLSNSPNRLGLVEKVLALGAVKSQRGC